MFCWGSSRGFNNLHPPSSLHAFHVLSHCLVQQSFPYLPGKLLFVLQDFPQGSFLRSFLWSIWIKQGSHSLCFYWSGPQHFRHQGLVLWKTNFSTDKGMGGQFEMIQAHYIYCALYFYYYYISFAPDPQALDDSSGNPYSTVSLFPADHNELSLYQFEYIQLQVTEYLTNRNINKRNISLSLRWLTVDSSRLIQLSQPLFTCHQGPRPFPFRHPQPVGCILPHGHKIGVVAPSITSSHLSIQEGRTRVGKKIDFLLLHSLLAYWYPFFPIPGPHTLLDAPILTTQINQTS